MTFPILNCNFWFRIGEDPSESMRSLLDKMGLRVIQISKFPLLLSGAERLQIYIDPQGLDTSDIRFALLAHQGFMNIPIDFIAGDPQPIPPPIEPVVLKKIRVLATSLYVRAAPVEGQILRTVSKDNILSVYEVDPASGWYRISQDTQEWVTKSPLYVADI